MTIKAGIVGYGNLGQAVEYLIGKLDDFELFGIFSRRETLDTDATVLPGRRCAQVQRRHRRVVFVRGLSHRHSRTSCWIRRTLHHRGHLR